MAKILIIDSEPKMGKALIDFLSAKGFQAGWVSNGIEAAKILNHDTPDLILVDQGIAMTGIKTIQILRIKPDDSKEEISMPIRKKIRTLTVLPIL